MSDSRALRAIVCLCLGVTACNDDGGNVAQIDAADRGGANVPVTDGGFDAQTLDGQPDAGPPDAGPLDAGPPDAGSPPSEPLCDGLDPAACVLPWPSAVFLEPDAQRQSGYTLNFSADGLPTNVLGTQIDPTAWRRMDGYGLGTPIMAVFPKLDITQLAAEWDLQESMAVDAHAQLFRVEDEGLTRVPYWAELDAHEQDPLRQVLFVRPAEILHEDSRYIIAFKSLRDTDDQPIAPSEAFASLRDGATADDPALAARQANFDELLGLLEAEGLDRGELTLAWDFRTASGDALQGRLLEMRDKGLAATGVDGPELTLVNIEEYSAVDAGDGTPSNPHIWLRIEGTMRVPIFMRELTNPNDVTGFAFNLDAEGALVQNGWSEERFWAIVPHSAKSGRPHGLVQYGHGLFGYGLDVGELEWSRDCDAPTPRPCGWFNARIANQHDLIFFASDLVGMAEDDRSIASEITGDFTYFPWIADRLHQGLLQYVLLARAMRERFGQLEALAPYPMNINGAELYYSGISQGGIFGATYMAISPDLTYGHLGVPGQNYATQLSRSVDFAPFFSLIQAFHPSTIDQSIMLPLIQLLWDGTDPVSYYRHITAEPFPGNVPHYILAAPAKGDYQVPPVTIEMTARGDLGIALMANYDDERTVPLVEETPYPHPGSGIVGWHFGNPWAPPGNLPPAEDEWTDPHTKARHVDAHNQQMVTFFRTGTIVDVCDGGLCPAPSASVMPCDDGQTQCPDGLVCVQAFCRAEP